MATQPIMEYSFKVNGKDSMSGQDKVSFKENYNSLDITYKCTNQSLNRYQVWVTYVNDYDEENYSRSENWGRGVGICALDTPLPLESNKSRTSRILADNSIFTKGDGLYRLALCARGDIDQAWDVTVLMFSLKSSGQDEKDKFIASDGEFFEVIESEWSTLAVVGTTKVGQMIIGTD